MLTPSELTILGLIVEQPRHGYDLERLIETRGMRRWTDIGFSSIYYLLTKLAGQGLIEPEPTSGGSRAPGPRPRRVYRATEAGRRAAAEAARSCLAESRPPANPVMAGLANLELLSAGEYRSALNSRLAGLDGRIAELAATQEASAPLPVPAAEVISYAQCLLAAERAWLAERVQEGR